MKNKTRESEVQRALERLYKRRRFGIRPGLDVEQEILKRLGNPERCCPVIHVAGTNGKGSVCALLESMLRAAGYRVGLYTSPHLARFHERIRVGNREISGEALARVVAEVEQACDEIHGHLGWTPTFFESATAMAFLHFQREQADVAVIEVGMGGRLDATNVVMPLISVITRVSLEHTAYLGATIEAIAGEKCGIVKPGRPVVAGPTCKEAWPVIRRIARERGCRLIEAEQDVNVAVRSPEGPFQTVSVETPGASYGTLRFPLIGLYQIENLATAVATAEVLRQSGEIRLSERDVATGVATVAWPGRFQALQADPPLVLDGAHNPGAAEALARSVKRLYKGKSVSLVTGMCRDKDGPGFLKAFAGLARRLWAVPLETEPERSMRPSDLCAIGRGLGLEASESVLTDAVAKAEAWAHECGGVGLITGSLFLVGEVLALKQRIRH
ncbi:MAG: folylpolyglutamate synthase/dihydrofolate synthase family protein [Verrucomicrobiota bacterium]|nr:folylpolyglutamate synthase/dihydrofolate synthase family protein [Verrucomicrobiota bacterium]